MLGLNAVPGKQDSTCLKQRRLLFFVVVKSVLFFQENSEVYMFMYNIPIFKCFLKEWEQNTEDWNITP